jgi:hypothetical protein
MVDAFGLRKGMVVTATKIVEVPVSVVSQERSVTGTMPTPPGVPQAPASATSQEKSVSGATPTPPPNPPADAPLIIAEGEPTPVPADTETPATPANPVPAVGSHFLFIAVGLLVLLVLIVLLVAKFIRAKN